MAFFKDYFDWNSLDMNAKKQCVLDCVKFYEAKTVEYILSNIPMTKRENYHKEPIKVEYTDKISRQISFGDNVVFLKNSALQLNKKPLFFNIAQSTICAVFARMFRNTTSNSNKKTKFGVLASGFLASITSEFAKGEDFANDMMEQFEMAFAQEVVME